MPIAAMCRLVEEIAFFFVCFLNVTIPRKNPFHRQQTHLPSPSIVGRRDGVPTTCVLSGLCDSEKPQSLIIHRSSKWNKRERKLSPDQTYSSFGNVGLHGAGFIVSFFFFKIFPFFSSDPSSSLSPSPKEKRLHFLSSVLLRATRQNKNVFASFAQQSKTVLSIKKRKKIN